MSRNTSNRITSKVVGKIKVRIPWKIVNGIMSCLPISRIVFNQGGNKYGLYFFLMILPLLMSSFVVIKELIYIIVCKKIGKLFIFPKCCLLVKQERSPHERKIRYILLNLGR